jgi:nitrate reductase alpha subunit
MLRVKYNHAYPYNIIMMKHAPFIATEKSVKAHETRPDGRALSANTGYQANLRYGSQQSVTRNWHMPMHQTDTLFHKAKARCLYLRRRSRQPRDQYRAQRDARARDQS